jgi:hypothetical protein
MPFVRFLVSKHYALLVTSISLNREIMNPYSYYTRKGLVYIILTVPFSYQSFSYLKCTKVNTQLFCNIYSILLNKYIFLTARLYTF